MRKFSRICVKKYYNLLLSKVPSTKKTYLCKKYWSMDSFKTLVQQRRSHRRFTGEPVSGDDVKLILRSALMSPTSKGLRAWQFVVVDEKNYLLRLSDAKSMGSSFLSGAALVVAVLGDDRMNDCWVEDASIAAFAMQLQAEDLGLGSCWVQIRGRATGDGESSEDIVRGILDIPANLRVLCLVAFGHAADERKPQDETRLKWEQVHVEKY